MVADGNINIYSILYKFWLAAQSTMYGNFPSSLGRLWNAITAFLLPLSSALAIVCLLIAA